SFPTRRSSDLVMNQILGVFDEFCVEGIEANIEKCQSYVDKSLGVITALNPHIGYKKATKIAKEALETGVSIRDLILRDNILSEEEIDRILNPFEMTKPGIAGK